MSESQLNSRDITFRTVFHDVEGIKSYLRRIRKENERVMTNIQSIVYEQVQKAFSSAFGLNSLIISAVDERIEEFINPLQTEWINDEFINYIASSTDDNTINVISNAFMSIVEYNSTNFNAYINNALTTGAVEAFISPLKTEWISDYFISYIASNIGGVPGSFTTQDIQQTIADQFPEIDVKNILKDYHLIEKHYTTLTSNVMIDISGLTNPATAIERFRILAYVSGDKSTDNLHYTYTSTAITEDAYSVNNGDLVTTILTIANMNIDNSNLNVEFNTTVDYNSYVGGTLWYGFTDLVNPEQSSTDYTVMVSIDGSPNYLQLLTSAGERFTVGYNERLGYISGAAEAIRNQFGNGINVVEVVPHPLLVNDSERYTVLRAITNSTTKGNWKYRGTDSYEYTKTYDRSVLKFSPLETPIMYANLLTDTNGVYNYYIHKLNSVFDNRTDIYSIDLSNFVPWTNVLPNLLTTTKDTDPKFNNINVLDSAQNFGQLDITDMCLNDSNLASIDLRCIHSMSSFNGSTSAFTSCVNLRTVYCNESVKDALFSALPTSTSYAWNYITDIGAWVASATF